MIKKLFLNDKIILILIILNAIIIFISGFEFSEIYKSLFLIVDNIITVLFIVEIIIKLNEYGVKGYFSSNWNKFDFILIVLSIPSLISFFLNIEFASVGFLLVFRALRVFKSFRFLKFIPGIEEMIKGIQRALKASTIVFLGLFIYIFIVGTCSFYFFKSTGTEYFNNPLNSLYSIFKIFTIEGWVDIPNDVTKNYSSTKAFFTDFYFIFILLSGGIVGLSLLNSIFVDAMISDNNDELEKKIDHLDKKISELIVQSKPRYKH